MGKSKSNICMIHKLFSVSSENSVRTNADSNSVSENKILNKCELNNSPEHEINNECDNNTIAAIAENNYIASQLMPTNDGLIDVGPDEPLQPPILFELTTKYLFVSIALFGPINWSHQPAALSEVASPAAW